MSSRETVDDVSQQLRSYRSELLTLNGSSENDFLTLGNDLAEVSSLTSDISTMARTVAGLLSGRDVEGYGEALERFLNDIRTHLDLSGRQFVANVEALRSVLRTSDRMAAGLDGFQRIVKHLRVLGISTKIESARLEIDNTFDHIADDVAKLGGLIESRSGEVRSALSLSVQAIRETLSRVNLFETRERGKSQVLIEAIAGNIVSLSRKHQLSSSAVVDVITRSEGMARNVGQIVSSLQFHDITRQEIEHVTEAIDDLCGKLSCDDEMERFRDVFVEDVCRLQASQLENAKDEFKSALHRTMDSFCNIARDAAEISREVAALVNASGATGSSFLTEFRLDVETAISMLNENREANRELRATLDRVASTISDLAAFVGGIEEIGVDMELLAFNAQIRAAHTGSEGAALSVLAEAVRTLSEDARRQTDSISRALTDVSAASQKLGGAEEDGEKSPKLDHMAESLAVLLGSLSSIEGQVASIASRMAERVATVKAAVEGLVSGVTVHKKMEGVLDGIVEGLKRIADEAVKIAPAAAVDHTRKYLSRLETRYTMRKERNIHESILHGNTARAPSLGGVSAGELGENVELF